MQHIAHNDQIPLPHEGKRKQFNQHSHYIDVLLLVLTKCLGISNCLIRADFNFIIPFFAYFIKQSKWNSLTIKLEIALLLTTFVFDIVYCLTEIRVWYQNDYYQPIWQTIYPMHIFATGTFLIQLLLKIAAFALLFKLKAILVK